MTLLRRPGFPLVGGTSDAVPVSFPAQCTRRSAADLTFQLPDGRYVALPRSL